WRTRADARPGRRRVYAATEYLEGEHDGYASRGVRHGRRVLWIKGDYWIVLDHLTGSGRHRLDLHRHLAREARLPLPTERAEEGVVLAEARRGLAGLGLGIAASAPLRAQLVRGAVEPAIQGWVSARYGERAPAWTVRATQAGELPAAFGSVLIPRTRAAHA